MPNVKVFFDTDPGYNCTRIMGAFADGTFPPLPATATGAQEIPDTAIPQDRTFRNAWVQVPGGVQVDLPKARIIARQKIEAHRQEKMRDLLLREALGENVTAAKAQVKAINSGAAVAAAATEVALKVAMTEAMNGG